MGGCRPGHRPHYTDMPHPCSPSSTHALHARCTHVAARRRTVSAQDRNARRGAAPPTSPSTPTPTTPHDDAIVARAEADKAAANQSILQRLGRLYEDSHGPSASTTTDARARTRQQETVVRQLEHDATVAEAAVNAATDPSSPTTTPGTPVSRLYRDALLARTAADKARADLLTAQLCATNQREVGGRPVVLTCVIPTQAEPVRGITPTTPARRRHRRSSVASIFTWLTF